MSLKMYITIIDIKGEKMIDLSYRIQNFDSSKEVAVVRMLSDNIQYKMTVTTGKQGSNKNSVFVMF